MALSGPSVGLLFRSMDGTGEWWPLKRDSASAIVSGVGMTEVASPKSEFMSSNRTLAVSGYMNQTVRSGQYSDGGCLLAGQRTDDKTDGAEERMQEIQTPLDPVLQDRRHLSHEPVEGPIGCRAKTGTLGSNT